MIEEGWEEGYAGWGWEEEGNEELVEYMRR